MTSIIKIIDIKPHQTNKNFYVETWKAINVDDLFKNELTQKNIKYVSYGNSIEYTIKVDLSQIKKIKAFIYARTVSEPLFIEKCINKYGSLIKTIKQTSAKDDINHIDVIIEFIDGHKKYFDVKDVEDQYVSTGNFSIKITCLSFIYKVGKNEESGQNYFIALHIAENGKRTDKYFVIDMHRLSKFIAFSDEDGYESSLFKEQPHNGYFIRIDDIQQLFKITEYLIF